MVSVAVGGAIVDVLSGANEFLWVVRIEELLECVDVLVNQAWETVEIGWIGE